MQNKNKKIKIKINKFDFNKYRFMHLLKENIKHNFKIFY